MCSVYTYYFYVQYFNIRFVLTERHKRIWLRITINSFFSSHCVLNVKFKAQSINLLMKLMARYILERKK